MADMHDVKQDGSYLLAEPHPDLQDSLESLTPLDTLATANDQSMITEEEIKNSQEETKKANDENKIKSTNEYWCELLGLEKDPEIPWTLTPASTSRSSVAGNWLDGIDPDEDVKMQQREEYEFPDEVDTPENVPAKEHFAQYRGLRSFVKSSWDKNESLPLPYSRVFHVSDFDVAAKRILNQPPPPFSVKSGQKIRVFLTDVPHKVVPIFLDHPEQRPLILSG